MNYAEIDNKTNWHYRVDLWKAVRAHGFESIAEAYHTKYLETGSLSKTGDLFGVAGNTIGYTLKKMGVKVKGRGGPNNYKTGKYCGLYAKKLKKAQESRGREWQDQPNKG